ncbi:DNA-binding protein [Streptosporangium lutulentum]
MTDQSQGKDDIPSNRGAGAPSPGSGRYTTLAQVASATEQELLRLHGMGPKAIRLLRAALAERDLALTDQET